MITLHKLGHSDESFQLNPDLIVSVESRPDTVITLATSAKVVVSDTPEQVATAVRCWRAEVLAAALKDGRPQSAAASLSANMPAARPEPYDRREPLRLRALPPTRPVAALGGGDL